MEAIQPINPNRVVKYPSENSKRDLHICYICNNIAIDPRMCNEKFENMTLQNQKKLKRTVLQRESTCEAVYCYFCIENYLKKKPFCPKCRETKDQMFKRPWFLESHQCEVLVTCQFKSYGCDEVYSLEEIFEHQENQCTFRPRICPNCAKPLPKEESQISHQQQDCLASIRYHQPPSRQICNKCYQLKPYGIQHQCQIDLGNKLKSLQQILEQQNFIMEQMAVEAEQCKGIHNYLKDNGFSVPQYKMNQTQNPSEQFMIDLRDEIKSQLSLRLVEDEISQL